MVAKCQKSIDINLESSGEFYLKALHNNDSIQMNVDGNTDGIYNRLVPSTKIIPNLFISVSIQVFVIVLFFCKYIQEYRF